MMILHCHGKRMIQLRFVLLLLLLIHWVHPCFKKLLSSSSSLSPSLSSSSIFISSFSFVPTTVSNNNYFIHNHHHPQLGTIILNNHQIQRPTTTLTTTTTSVKNTIRWINLLHPSHRQRRRQREIGMTMMVHNHDTKNNKGIQSKNQRIQISSTKVTFLFLSNLRSKKKKKNIIPLFATKSNEIGTIMSSTAAADTIATETTTTTANKNTIIYPNHDKNNTDVYNDQTTNVVVTTNVTTNNVSSSSDSDLSILLETTIQNWFQGDFDNYEQVLDDQQQGYISPKEGGGHEHIHCILVPVTNNTRLAAFYFDGNPSSIFRFRYYEFHITTPTPNIAIMGEQKKEKAAAASVDTKLYTLTPELEKLLRSCSDPVQWPRIFHNYNATTSTSSSTTTTPPTTITPTNDSRIQLLPKCDVRWSFHLDPIQHSYAMEYEKVQKKRKEMNSNNNNNNNQDGDSEIDIDGNGSNGIHAIMVYGEALVRSQMIPGTQILIKDQLSLYNNLLFIHDRGYHPITMEYIYGNQREIPYQLKRVTNFIKSSTTTSSSDVSSVQSKVNIDTNRKYNNNKNENKPPSSSSEEEGVAQDVPFVQPLQLNRVIMNEALQWTLGSQYRTEKEYQEKIHQMGGPSVNIPSVKLLSTSSSSSIQQQQPSSS